MLTQNTIKPSIPVHMRFLSFIGLSFLIFFSSSRHVKVIAIRDFVSIHNSDLNTQFLYAEDTSAAGIIEDYQHHLAPREDFIDSQGLYRDEITDVEHIRPSLLSPSYDKNRVVAIVRI